MSIQTQADIMLNGPADSIGDIPLPEALEECFYHGAQARAPGFGGTSDDRWTLGHMRLTFAVMREFGIHRLPTHPERFVLRPDSKNQVPNYFRLVASALEQVSAQQWRILQNAMRDVYAQLQERLARDYPTGNAIKLRALVCEVEPCKTNTVMSRARSLPARSCEFFGPRLA